MVTKAKQRGKAKRKVSARKTKKRVKRAVKARRPKKKVMKRAAQEKGAAKESGLFAVIRIRGPVGVRKGIRDTLIMLRLDRVNHCVLVPANPSYKGMLHKVEECITWGEINDTTLEKLIFKRGQVGGEGVEKGKAKELAKKMLTDVNSVKGSKLKPVFRLNPPSRGYKSVRKFYPKGDLGYREDKINGLLKRMI